MREGTGFRNPAAATSALDSEAANLLQRPASPLSRLNLCDEKLVLTAVTRDVCYMFLRIVYCRGRSQMH